MEYPWVLKTIGGIPCRGVLDVGCGPVSIIPLWLSNVGYEVWACDLRPSRRTVAGVNFIQGDISNTDALPRRYFDVATCISVIEHVGLGRYSGDKTQNDAAVRFLRSFRRFLKPGGKVIVTFPFGKPAMCANPSRIDAYRIMDEEQARTLAADAGFRIDSMECFRLEEGYWRTCDAQHAASLDSRSQVNALCCAVMA